MLFKITLEIDDDGSVTETIQDCINNYVTNKYKSVDITETTYRNKYESGKEIIFSPPITITKIIKLIKIQEKQ